MLATQDAYATQQYLYELPHSPMTESFILYVVTVLSLKQMVLFHAPPVGNIFVNGCPVSFLTFSFLEK
jgi:hypothetical protein